ncbi:MAG TPA: aminotransferase class V-fold PLP-dependent enzyme [Devosia sp.]|nr:aminotransferase class V-fold PLP-dependent enzyme [Devosia sp.]
MSEELRSLFAKAMDEAIAYRERVAIDPKPPQRDYHALREAYSGPVPETGTAPEAVIEELIGMTEGGLMPMTGPRFFGWVIGASQPVGVAADWLVSAWGQNAGYHSPTPAAAVIEEIAESWLIDLLDLPRGSAVGFVTGATVANGVCLAAARTGTLLAQGWNPDADGLFGAPPVHVLIGADAHSSLFSSLQLIGFGYNRVIKIATDDQGRMLSDALEAAIAPLDGPKIVIAQAGQINTGAFDPFTDVVRIGKAHGAWVHVDGAFGLWARVTPSRRHLTEGIEAADSWVTDGHKWLQAPYDTGFAIVRDKEVLLKAMTQWSSYLPSIGQGDRVPSNYVPELSRRARGIPVWALIRQMGREGIAAMVARHCDLARRLAQRLSQEPGIRVLNDVVLNQVAVNFGTGDAASRKAMTEAVIARVQKGGILFAGGAQWRDDWIMRLSVISAPTTEADIDMSADAIVTAWREVQAG